MIDLFFEYQFMRHALYAALLIGICVGVLGPFLVLRRLSLVSDGMAHLAFGGIALGFLISTYPFLVAVIVVFIGSLVMKFLLKKMPGDSVIAVVLSTGVGLGVIILGITNGFGVDLFSFLIGSILTVSTNDLILLGSVALVVLASVWYYKKEFFLMTFHSELAHLHSNKTKQAEYVFMLITALVVVVAIKAVGILLVTALVVLPTLIALQISRSFWQTVTYSSIISIIVTLIGVGGSYYVDVPPSGFIVVSLLAIWIIAVGVKSLLKR